MAYTALPTDRATTTAPARRFTGGGDYRFPLGTIRPRVLTGAARKRELERLMGARGGRSEGAV